MSGATPTADTKGTLPSQSSEGLAVVDNRKEDDYSDTGCADYETDSLEKMDYSNVDVEAAITPSRSPNNSNNNHTKKQAVSVSHDPPLEELSSVTEPSTEEVLLSDHGQEEKSNYIEEEEVPERVEGSKSKVTRRPERISSGSVRLSKRELKEIKDIIVRLEKTMDQRNHRQKIELKLDDVFDVTSKTREEIAAIRNTQEEIRKL